MTDSTTAPGSAGAAATAGSTWPALARDGSWPETQDALHLLTQMLGKLRLGLAPALPEWSHAPLSLSPRGLTTRAIAWDNRSIEASLDVIDRRIGLLASDGRRESIEIPPHLTIADIWAEFNAALRALDVRVDLWDKPQERPDTTPFAEDSRRRTFDGDLAGSWFALLTELQALFEAWRSPFFGRSGVNFWWGAFDLTVVLYNGRHAAPPPGSNYLMRHDLDAEHLSVGFWPGDARNEAMFFGYLVPEPVGCADFALGLEGANWVSAMSEWVLPYAAVRDSSDRPAMLRLLLNTVRRAAGELAGWDLASLAYEAPAGRRPEARGRPED